MKSVVANIKGRDLPLYLWGIGYLEFLWQTTLPAPPLGWFSWALFLALTTLVVLSRGRAWCADFTALSRELRRRPAYLALLLLFTASLALALFASFRPPHLPQEYDAVHYQMGVPRQLLVRHSLAWINWSVTDLWPMAMQWGMAPFFLAFPTVNKLPQFFFALGAAVCLLRLTEQVSPGLRGKAESLLPLFAVFSAHGIVTQLGTGMMDLPALYLLLLAASAALDERLLVSALALAVYTASKAFHPFQVAPALAGALAWAYFFPGRLSLRRLATNFLPAFLLLAALLLARPVAVSFRATGTPLFPFAPCLVYQGEYCVGERREAVDRTARLHLSTRTGYGEGDGPVAFVRHLWRVAIPTNGVNNEFDYPLGLPWLLLLPLLTWSLLRGYGRSPLFLLTLLFWALWWANAHQSRWLYPVLAFGFLATIPAQARVRRTLPALLLVSMAFSLLSQARALLPMARLSAAEIQAAEEAKVRWRGPGTLESIELLYVKEPAWDHVRDGSRWVLR